MAQSNMGSKAQIKEIIDRIERFMVNRAQEMHSRYIKAFPNIDKQAQKHDSSFVNSNMQFLQFLGSVTDEYLFRYSYVEAAISFLGSTGIDADYNQSSELRHGIAHLAAESQNTHYYLLKQDEEDFKSLYADDQDYFDYMLYALADGYIPSDFDYHFVHSLVKTVKDNDKVVIIVVDDGAQFSGKDFSTAGKDYIQKSIQFTADSLGVHLKGTIIDIVPFDYYFTSLRPGLAVSYFISRYRAAVQSHTVTMQNIGKLIGYDAHDLIARYAFASNNHIGSQYASVQIEQLKTYYANLPKPAIVTAAPFANPAYIELFNNISRKASQNLFWLEDPQVCKPLLTAEWMFNNVGDIEGFDNTFIGFGYLKLVEILLAKIIIQDYKGCEMSINPSQVIEVTEGNEDQLMLGNMIRFATLNPVSELAKHEHCRAITAMLLQWKNEIRNGYFHKHSLERTELSDIRNRTFEVIYSILGTLPK